MSRLVDVVVPANEEGTRATILRWCKMVGDEVIKDEPLLELETDKVTVEIASPATGTLREILKPVDAEVLPDEVLARLSNELDGTPGAAAAGGSRHGRNALSPSVRRLLHEHSLSATDISGTGRNGRITAQDVTRHAAKAATSSSQIPHSAIRRRVAEHMARSLLEAAHVTTLFEADLSRVLAHRKRHAPEYAVRGARLTLTAYFVSACARALEAHPEVNASFLPNALELHADVNIGVGTALGTKGLIVPVIHRAHEMNLFGIAQRLGHVVETARAGKLTTEDVRGGTFTISNHGVGGSLLAAPIVINQPQVAILGAGKVQRRVCVVNVGQEEVICIRSMCYLTLTIDHRALDAFQANAFLSLVVTTLEEWPDGDS